MGMTRTTGQAEVVRAALNSIAYQITDIVKAMSKDSDIEIEELRVDGGPTKNRYLMQFQSDILRIPVQVASIEELSGTGAAYAAGIALNLYEKDQIFSRIQRRKYDKKMKDEEGLKLYKGWKDAVGKVLTYSHNC